MSDDTAIGTPQTLEEMAVLLRAEQDTNLLLQEALADVELAADDIGWNQLSTFGQQQFTREGLRRIAENARLSAIVNPLIRRGVQLGIAYVWGQGINIAARAADDADSGQDVNAVVQAFLDDQSNRGSFTSGQAREENERSLKTDGNVFLALFTNPRTGRVQVRSTPFDEIQDVITNPEDRDEPWFYLRQWQTRDIGPGTAGTGRTVLANQTRRSYHPALNHRPASRPKSIDSIPVMWDAPMLHVYVNRLDGWKFGIGDAYAALAWARAYKDFLTDWAKLVKALSRYAWRVTGDKSTKVRDAVSKIREATATPNGQPAAGATAALGPGATLEAIPKTGATIDSNSGKPLAGMAAAAFGVPVTMLLADPGQTGARAVAETLDRPTELEQGMRRTLWTDVHRRILDYVVDQAVKAPAGQLLGTVLRDQDGRETITLAGDVERTVDITWPDMTEADPKTLVDAVVAADQTGKMHPLVVARLLLEALNVDDVDEILDNLTDDQGRFVDPQVSAGQAATDAFRRGDA